MISTEDILYWIGSASVMIVLVSILRTHPKRKMGSKFINCLWLIVLIRLLCPILPQRSFQIIHWQELTSFLNQRIQGNGVENALDTQMPFTLLEGETQEIAYENVQGLSGIEGIKIEDALMILWLVGSLLMLGYWLYQYHKSKEHLRKQGTIQNQAILGCLEHTKKELHIKAPIQLVEGDSAMIFGVIQPVIILPKTLSLEEAELILTHECMHYKRKDHLINLLQLIALILHWYNPLVWMMKKQSKEDREWACDQDVLAKGKSRKDYASLLVKMATQTREEYYLAQGMKGNSKVLEERIKEMFKERKIGKRDYILWTGILVVGMLWGLTNPIQSKEEKILGDGSNITIKESEREALPPNEHFEVLEDGKKTVISIQIPTLESGENSCMGPMTLQKGDTWEVSLDWEGNGQIYVLCQKDATKLFTDCQSVGRMEAPIQKVKFTIEETDEYYFFVKNHKGLDLYGDTDNDIKGTITISHQS